MDMPAPEYEFLTKDQVDSFLENGYLVVKRCFNEAFARRWTDEAYVRLGYDPSDPGTWAKDIVWMDRKNTARIRDVSPRAWGALCEVVGGEVRLEDRIMQIESSHFTTIDAREWSDAFIVNFHRGADEPWQPPSAAVKGWHKDGSFFRHFLDSREQALLTIVLWSRVEHRGGGTFVAPDSVRHVARYLADHPEGVRGVPAGELMAKCERFVEVTGDIGDFIILHPFMLHASSQNVLGKPRFMTNPPVVLKEPLNLNRANPDEFSLLERATLHYLGVDRLDFRPTAPREEDWVVIG